MTFGEKLQRLRKAAGMSQEQLAAQIEVSRQAVSKWELGESLPDTSKILLMAKIFDVSTDYLLDDTITEQPPTSPQAQDKKKRYFWPYGKAGKTKRTFSRLLCVVLCCFGLTAVPGSILYV
ncbi:MAG: helix-turn-helix transcriptional regulator [Angelakisella sp.]|nr:helix-turn-helix transcriptional regulator [Angelakisella sp.]